MKRHLVKTIRQILGFDYIVSNFIQTDMVGDINIPDSCQGACHDRPACRVLFCTALLLCLHNVGQELVLSSKNNKKSNSFFFIAPLRDFFTFVYESFACNVM